MSVLRYERLPDLCYHCGIIGHPLLECPLKPKDGSPLKYTDFIRAESSQGLGGRKRMKASPSNDTGAGRNNSSRQPLTEMVNLKKTVMEKAGKPGIDGGDSEISANFGGDIDPKDLMDSTIPIDGKFMAVSDLINVEIGKDFEPRDRVSLARNKLKSKLDGGIKAGLGIRAKDQGFKKALLGPTRLKGLHRKGGKIYHLAIFLT